ncbi:radical SAM protein [bacterium]|nr:radical SAM protein [bacterium]
MLLAKPGNFYRSWPFSNDFMKHIFPVAAATYPQLAGAAAEYRPEFLDGLFEPIHPDRWLERAAQADVVAMGVVSPVTSLNTELAIRRLKKANPRVRVILGGHHSSLYAEEWLRRGVDYIVRGEGELAFRELLHCIEDGVPPREVSGVSWVDDGRYVHNEAKDFVQNLDDLPMPDWSMLNWDIYNLGLAGRGRSATIETARGCPFPCTFCSVSVLWDRSQRFKSPDRLMEELRTLDRLGVRQLVFGDDNFGAKPARDMVLFERMLSEGLDMSWWCFIRVDTVLRRPEFVKMAGRAGLRFAFVGYESLDDGELRRFAKDPSARYTVADYKTVYQRLHDAGVFVYGLFVRHSLDRPDSFKSWLKTRSVADITAQTRFIPIAGTSAASDLRELGYTVKDSFYQDRGMPAYQREGKDQSSKFVFTALIDLLQPSNFRKMIAGTHVERQFFRRLYGGMLTDGFGVTWRRFGNLMAANDASRTLNARQNRHVASAARAVGLGVQNRERPGDAMRLSRRLRAAWNFWSGKETANPFPPAVTIETTSKCSLDCPMCLRERDTTTPIDMATDVYENIIGQLAGKADHVLLYGLGEPLQDKAIVDRVRSAANAGLNVQLSTNAMPLTRSRSAELIDAGLRFLVYSVDSLDPDTYEKLRPGGKLPTVLRNIEDFEKENASRGRPVHTAAQMVVMPANRGEIPSFNDYWRKAGVDTVRFKHDEVLATDVPREPRTQPCPVLWRGPLHIRADGRVHACCHHFDAEPVGDSRSQSISDIWNGAPLRELRRMHAEGRGDEIAACHRCRYKPPARALSSAAFLLSTRKARRWIMRWERLRLATSS